MNFLSSGFRSRLDPVFGKTSPHSSVNLLKQVFKLKVQEIIRIIRQSVEIVKAFRQIIRGFGQTVRTFGQNGRALEKPLAIG